VSDKQFDIDISGMEQEWRYFRSAAMGMLECVVRSDRSSIADMCNKLWGAFEFLERASARRSCTLTPCSEQEVGKVDCQMDTVMSIMKPLFGLELYSDQVPAMLLRDALMRFSDMHLLAQIGRRCAYTGPWPPVTFSHAASFQEVSSIRFAHSLLGKYMFRVHNVAGVRS